MIIASEKNIRSLEGLTFWGTHMDNIQDPTKN